MRIFIDSADFREVEKWLRQGVVDGVTTNPSIMLKDGVYDMEEGVRRLCALLGDRPVSAEVTTDAFDNDQVIVVTATGGASGIYEYSLDNGPWQEGNTFTGVVPAGLHTVRARDIYGCGEASTEVLTVDYPPYFTFVPG